MIRRLVVLWQRMVGEGRVVCLGLDLWLRGHHRAARMVRMWKVDRPTKADVAATRAKLLRRYPGR